jgi:hypothetical protein
MRLFWSVVLGSASVAALGQAAPEQQPSDVKAQQLMQQMITALGGQRWLTMPGYELIGRTAGFYQGNPTGSENQFWDYREFPDHERIELGKKRQVIEIFNGNQGWEVTYRGKRALPKDELNDYLRRRDHSVEVAARIWLKDPKTILLYGGQETVERHLAEKVTLISASNDAITLDLDAETHLPLRRTFQWRNPVYGDKDTEVEEYDDYHTFNGFPTPFTISRYHNGDMTNQRFLVNVDYGGEVPAWMFDVDLAARKLKK